MSPTDGEQAAEKPLKYLPDPGLEKAADVAIRLGMPLLLSGEPGVGKTQAAYWLAEREGLGTPIEFAVRSTSTASDLFYHFNAISHYYAASLEARAIGVDPLNAISHYYAASLEARAIGPETETRGRDPKVLARTYLTFQGLGEAILRAAPIEIREQFSPPSTGAPRRSVRLRDYVLEQQSPRQDPPQSTDEPRRSLVLLDEIDKAPRDLPNDILRAIERMSFNIPELESVTIEAAKDHRPVVVLTSNSERALPDAFLRRCIYYHIEFPESKEPRGREESRGRLEAIVKAHYPRPDSARLALAVEVFEKFRKEVTGKKPATAEPINYFAALSKDDRLMEDWKATAKTCLVKTQEDLESVDSWLKGWMPEALPSDRDGAAGA